MGKKIALDAEFKIVIVPLPQEKVAAWKASMNMLLDWIKEEVNKQNDILFKTKKRRSSLENRRR